MAYFNDLTEALTYLSGLTTTPFDGRAYLREIPKFAEAVTWVANAMMGALPPLQSKAILYTNSAGDSITVNGASLNFDGNSMGIGVPAPYNQFHVRGGASGAGSSHGNNQVTVESDDHVGIQFLCPNTKTAYLMFGDPQSQNDGQISYNHAVRALYFNSGGANSAVFDTNQQMGVGQPFPAARIHGKVGAGTNRTVLRLDQETINPAIDVNHSGPFGEGMNIQRDANSANNEYCLVLGGANSGAGETGGVDGSGLEAGAPLLKIKTRPISAGGSPIHEIPVEIEGVGLGYIVVRTAGLP